MEVEPDGESAHKEAEGESGMLKKARKTRRGKKRQHKTGDLDITLHKKKASFSNRRNRRESKNLPRLRTRRYTGSLEKKRKVSQHRFNSEANKINRTQGYSLRPINVPKAPENSTQFLIDDHEECNLYKSFEVENPFNINLLSSDLTENSGDTMNEFSVDLDMQQRYFVNDFEHTYHVAKEEYLADLKKEHLISEIKGMERKLKDLETVVQENKQTKLLRNLQVKLVHLQEQNQMLKRENIYLRGCYQTSLKRNPDVYKDIPNSRSLSSSPSSSDDESCSTCNSSTSSSMSDCGSSCSECERERGKGDKVVMNGHVSDVEINGHITPSTSSIREENSHEAMPDIMVDEIPSSKHVQ